MRRKPCAVATSSSCDAEKSSMSLSSRNTRRRNASGNWASALSSSRGDSFSTQITVMPKSVAMSTAQLAFPAPTSTTPAPSQSPLRSAQ
eukprot:CAMPEP_0180522396 /NCGR_PEP_ID=MMETSP1036_2-20121128/57385_1 /TAXON_ID=632150 /ORGANISM="Azadinium spinosum, Strain 3D9" /LENGTH=88 /DNA_ID=CAMNT_0022535171 /DNA_START=28 /DNA_END=291 /DNA_ORIENTATION=-